MKKAMVLKSTVLGLMAYETAAITSGKVPTVSALSHLHWWVEAALVGAFLVDVHYLQARISECSPA